MIGVLLSSTGPVCTEAEPRVLRAGIGLNTDTLQGLGLRKFGELVELRSKGRIRVELFASGELGDDLTMINALRQGRQDITCPASSALARVVKDFSVVNDLFWRWARPRRLRARCRTRY